MKYSLMKYSLIKHSLIKHSLIKHGLIKHGLIKHSPWVLAVLVVACGGSGDPVVEARDCSYVPQQTAENPYPEMGTFAGCAELADGNLRIVREHLDALDFDQDGLATLVIEKQFYYVRADGTMAPVVTWDNFADDFSEGLARTPVGGKLAYIDKNLTVVLPPVYDWGWPFESGSALVCKGCRREKEPDGEHTAVVGGSWGFIDTGGAEIVPLTHASGEEARAALERTRDPMSAEGQTDGPPDAP